MSKLKLCRSTALVLAPAPLLAAGRDQGDILGIMGGTIRSSDTGDTTLFFVVAFTVIIVTLIASRVYTSAQARKAKAGKAPIDKQKGQDFKEQAVALGFKAGEIPSLQKIATRLAPKSPGSLLSTSAGREYLISDVSKRARRREREIAMLQSMLDRLEQSRKGHHQSRDTVRVDADLAIWFVQKMSANGPPEEGEGDGEEESLLNAEPVSGRLIDLSEGGAAVTVDLPLSAGEIVEFWSADTRIWIPPLSATVVSLDDATEDTGAVAHLHFPQPDLSEIRRAMQDIQLFAREEEELAEADTGLEDAGVPPPLDAGEGLDGGLLPPRLDADEEGLYDPLPPRLDADEDLDEPPFPRA